MTKFFSLLILLWTLLPAAADQADPGAAIDRAMQFLESTQQTDGGWQLKGKSDPAVTALVAKCFMQHPKYGPGHPIVERAMKFVLRHMQPDGGIYVEGEGVQNYQTSVALMALASADRPPFAESKERPYAEALKRAQQYLVKNQWDEEEGHDADDVWYGGAGYGKSKRPDMSNTQIMLDALHQSGLPSNHPVYQKALKFIERSQMRDESNDQPFAEGAGDGGFIYSPANGGESKAGTDDVAGKPRLRSYGSMSYAGFKSLLYAGLNHDDPRVKAAYDWIRRNYSLDENPNMPGAQSKEGLYYYYHIFARALDAWGEETLVDTGGRTHRWRAELCDKLVSLQHSDGSWSNEATRWYEDNPYLVTAYSVLALQTALHQDAPKR